MSTFKVTINSNNTVIEVPEEKNLLEAIRDSGIYIKSSCGGHATCSDCTIKILEGADKLTEPTFDELQFLGNVFHITKERLACQTKVTGDVTIDILNNDLSKDQADMMNKTKKAPVRVRKKDEVRQMYRERKEASIEREKEGESWQKHWEKDKDGKPKRLGGGKRPKLFRTDHLEEEQERKEVAQKAAAETSANEERPSEESAKEKDAGRDFRKKR